tara:strand:+ start:90 stop:365 length:276 start_codon:yes stop_codon:yes gene_type:complete
MNKNKNPSNVEETPDRIGKSAGHSNRPIDKHGDYDGTDVGFTSTSIQDPITNTNLSKNRKKDSRPINKHGNYNGTDVGFTSSSFSDQTIKD